MGRILVIFAIVLAIVGTAMWIGGGLGLGSLPGDVTIRRGSWSCAIPLLSSLILSVILTIVLNLLLRLFGPR